MFTDPQALKVGSATLTLPRVQSLGSSATYQVPDGTTQLVVSHSYPNGNKRARRTVRVNRRKVAADPVTALNSVYTSSHYFVSDVPQAGFTIEDLRADLKSLTDWLAVDANATKFLGGES